MLVRKPKLPWCNAMGFLKPALLRCCLEANGLSGAMEIGEQHFGAIPVRFGCPLLGPTIPGTVSMSKEYTMSKQYAEGDGGECTCDP